MAIANLKLRIHTHTQSGTWDLVIAHPPCTYLTVTGNRWFNIDRYGKEAVLRAVARIEAADFFLKFTNIDCNHVAIENPVGCMSRLYNKLKMR